MSATLPRWRMAGRLAPIAVLCLWEALGRAGAWDRALFPAPGDILAACFEPGAAASLFTHAWVTLRRAAGGFFLGSLAGLILGVVCGAFARLDRALGPPVEILRPLPSAALIAPAVLWLGLGDGLGIGLAAFASSWPVFTAARDGVRGAPAEFSDAARSLGLGPLGELWRVRLPSACPHCLTGLRVGLAVSVAVVVASEMVASGSGLGHAAMAAGLACRPAEAWAAVLAVGLLGDALGSGFLVLERLAGRLRPGLLDRRRGGRE